MEIVAHCSYLPDPMKEKSLQVGVVGGLGLMASPMAIHWKKGGPVQVVRVHDRGTPGDRRDKARQAWREHGTSLVSTFQELVGDGSLDGYFVCCGKNGEDVAILSELYVVVASRAKQSPRPFICHLSTVSARFAEAAQKFFAKQGVRYANYPLTGGQFGAERATMLILASGEKSLFDELQPALSFLGKPKYFGAKVAAGAEVKFMGHLMVFNGLMGICSAAALHTECFQDGKTGGLEQADFFDFLNTGAGGTRQWDLTLGLGVRNNIWEGPFHIKYAVVDALYTAEVCLARQLSASVIESVLRTALLFSYTLRMGSELGTHAIFRELIASRKKELDAFVAHYWRQNDLPGLLKACLESLPEPVRRSVFLDVTPDSFA